jgi:hypothetical protein
MIAKGAPCAAADALEVVHGRAGLQVEPGRDVVRRLGLLEFEDLGRGLGVVIVQVLVQ